MDVNKILWDAGKLLIGDLPALLRILAPFLWFGTAALLIRLVLRYYQKRALAASGIDDIDGMDGLTFEKYLEVLFENLGYRVERTPYVGDYGADLVTRKDGVKTVIQAKRYKKRVGVRAVQEAVAAKGKYGCSEAMVVTNSTYTRQAEELARANGVALWDRNRLINALLSVKKDSPSPREALAATPTPAAPSPPAEGAVGPVCVVCGKSVSDKVAQFCRSHPDRFGGKIYCFDHQKAVSRAPLS